MDHSFDVECIEARCAVCSESRAREAYDQFEWQVPNEFDY